MPVTFNNFDFSYFNGKKKPVFVPSEDGRIIGDKVKELVERSYVFDSFYWHFNKGGHVAALHEHREHYWFARIDLKTFFYTIQRQRVQRALRSCGVRRHEFFAKWSTVKNPYPAGGYVLPYGFVQSPILSSLVLSESDLGKYLRVSSKRLTVSVYLDDIGISSNDPALVSEVFTGVRERVAPSGFLLNEGKLLIPDQAIELFNCELRSGYAAVLEERRKEFYSQKRSTFSIAGFEDYCQSVETGNAP